jgi:hypothetical protein
MLSATCSFAVLLSAGATSAGQWNEVQGAKLDNSGLYDLAVVAPNDVWAVGGAFARRAQIEHWDGTNWSVVAVQPPESLLSGIAALSSTDVWAVGQNGGHNLVEHWDGRRWVVVPSPIVGKYDYLTAVSTISHNDVWAVGSSPPTYILMHWDGTSWSVVQGPPANSSGLSSIKAFATDDVWAVAPKTLTAILSLQLSRCAGTEQLGAKCPAQTWSMETIFLAWTEPRLMTSGRSVLPIWVPLRCIGTAQLGDRCQHRWMDGSPQ